MSEAPRTRPDGATVLHVLRGHVKARPKAVFEVIAAKLDPGPDAGSLFTADAAAWLVIAQGGWWYRAEYQVIPDGTGSHVEHTLLNVAERARGLGRFTGRKEIDGAPMAFDRLIAELRTTLE